MDIIPIEILTEQGLIAVLYAIFAAFGSTILEKSKKANKERTLSDGTHVEMIERAFNQMEKNLEELRERNDLMHTDVRKLYVELEEYRQKYHKQIEINNTQSAQLTKLNIELFYKNDQGLDKSK